MSKIEERELLHSYNLFYGLRDGELKHISEVQNGLKCNCICPACEKQLLARNGGRKRIHHFAHYKSAECRYAVQTAIHIAAKNIFEKALRIRIPDVYVFINTEIEKSNNRFISHGEWHRISNSKYIEIDKVILEKKLHRYIPDVVIISRNKKLIVEIAVTHFVGRDKFDKIFESKISALEIDLSKIRNDFNTLELQPLLLDQIENKNWLHNQYAYNQNPHKKQEVIDRINEENLFQWSVKQQQDLETEQIELMYKQYYLEIFDRVTHEGKTIKQVMNCPLEKRILKGQYYAIHKVDCLNCVYSRKERDNGKYLVCLHDYFESNNLQFDL